MNAQTLFEAYRAQLVLAQETWGGNPLSVIDVGQPCMVVPRQWSDLNSNQSNFWYRVAAEASGFRAYETQPGESVMGIALRELKDENRWTEIIELNQFVGNWPCADIGPHDYYPVHHIIRLPKTK